MNNMIIICGVMLIIFALIIYPMSRYIGRLEKVLGIKNVALMNIYAKTNQARIKTIVKRVNSEAMTILKTF